MRKRQVVLETWHCQLCEHQTPMGTHPVILATWRCDESHHLRASALDHTTSKLLGQDSQSNLADPLSRANGSPKAESQRPHPGQGRQVLQSVITKAQRLTGEAMGFDLEELALNHSWAHSV